MRQRPGGASQRSTPSARDRVRSIDRRRGRSIRPPPRVGVDGEVVGDDAEARPSSRRGARDRPCAARTPRSGTHRLAAAPAAAARRRRAAAARRPHSPPESTSRNRRAVTGAKLAERAGTDVGVERRRRRGTRRRRRSPAARRSRGGAAPNPRRSRQPDHDRAHRHGLGERLLDPRRRPSVGVAGQRERCGRTTRRSGSDQSVDRRRRAHVVGTAGRRARSRAGNASTTQSAENRVASGAAPARAVLIEPGDATAAAAARSRTGRRRRRTCSDQTTFFIASAGSHPRAAGGAPARRGRDGEFQAELVGRAHRRVDRLRPTRRCPAAPARARRAARPCRRRTAARRARRRRGASVRSRTMPGRVDVAVHPVPPRARASLVGRIDERLPERVVPSASPIAVVGGHTDASCHPAPAVWCGSGRTGTYTAISLATNVSFRRKRVIVVRGRSHLQTGRPDDEVREQMTVTIDENSTRTLTVPPRAAAHAATAQPREEAAHQLRALVVGAARGRPGDRRALRRHADRRVLRLHELDRPRRLGVHRPRQLRADLQRSAAARRGRGTRCSWRSAR